MELSKKRYVSERCQYSNTTLDTNRLVEINWKENIDKIIEMSTTSKDIKIDIAPSLIQKKKLSKKKKPKMIKIKDLITRKNVSETNNIEETIIEETKNDDEEQINNSFWNMISRLRWYDRDENMYLNPHTITRKFTRDEATFLLRCIKNIYIPKLSEKLIETNIFSIVASASHNNILTHIILKGKVFYNAILDSPDLCLYLHDQYYPCYDWLNHYTN